MDVPEDHGELEEVGDEGHLEGVRRLPLGDRLHPLVEGVRGHGGLVVIVGMVVIVAHDHIHPHDVGMVVTTSGNGDSGCGDCINLEGDHGDFGGFGQGIGAGGGGCGGGHGPTCHFFSSTKLMKLSLSLAPRYCRNTPSWRREEGRSRKE